MRIGVVVLTDLPWAEAAPRWRSCEEMGLDHAWTYDHLVWGGLPDADWRGAMPVLGAVAATTSRIGLGTFVSSPNFRHPVPLLRDVQALEDVSEGRFLLGIGTGGDRDSAILGGPDLSVRERVDRFQEMVDLLVRLRAEDHVDAEGRWFSAHDARTLPPLRRTPLLLAGNGPRSVRYAARTGDGWVTTGTRADSVEEWWQGHARAREVLEEALAAAGRDPASYPRYLNLDAGPSYSLESVGAFEDAVGRAEELGFTDVVTHWPRPDGPYAGDEQTLVDAVSARGRP
ncbi:luciferase [Marmoricola endophyticus]|uniref:Luciferase n=1 Tax=Marmoricola endophyticus TaxID=2040280 RepID=A0A917BKV6_9ACTN|nr:LLM class flavin-dependent oxidoreductase [Marmoricola endophyticus]GGF47157.1 luciferase [Marmoricola endophyticus]